MAEKIEGKISTSFTKGSLGLRIYSFEDLENPLKHVTQARFASDKQQINNGYVVMVDKSMNLIIQIGYQTDTKSYGFGVQITREDDKLVDALYFPSKGKSANDWNFGTISVDDAGMKFLVRAIDNIGAKYSKLRFTVWPIVEWKVGENRFGKNTKESTLVSQTRSASLAGIDQGDFKGLEKDMRFARVVSENLDKRQDLAVTFLTGSVEEIKK